MWHHVASYIIKYRFHLLIFLLVITSYMTYLGQSVEWTHEIMRTVPKDDPEMTYFNEFQEIFKEDDNVMIIAMKDSNVYKLKNFSKLNELTKNIDGLEGIDNTLSLSNMMYLYVNKEEKRFEIKKLFDSIPSNQHQLDSILSFASTIKLYENRLVNNINRATLIIININSSYLNSEKRKEVIEHIYTLGDRFSFDTNINLHYTGLPFVRHAMKEEVTNEVYTFLGISILITLGAIYFLFRSFLNAFLSLVLVSIAFLWLRGIIFLLGFKMTVFTGLLQTILVVISIPNCIYFFNKYHQEILNTNDKRKAIYQTIKKVGVIIFLTNSTTAIGFFVLAFTDIVMLQEFGIVATITIISTFFISIIFLPSIFLYLPFPQKKDIRHLHFKPTNYLINQFQFLIDKKYQWIFAISIFLSIVSFIGSTRLKPLSYMVDDLPRESRIMQDLRFFEENFKGIMPLEIVINTGVPKGIRKPGILKKVNEIENYLASFSELTYPISFLSFIKSAHQAYNNYYSDTYFSLPSKREQTFIYKYLKNSENPYSLIHSFIDSTERYMRLSMYVADVGSDKMDLLINQKIRPKLDSIFKEDTASAIITGTTAIFSKNNMYLIDNLKTTMFIAFSLIALLMGLLFKNVHIVIISVIPNLIPLLITAGIMGFMDIPLKPSTVLIFSISFGISVDDSIHFLIKYRQELMIRNYCVSESIRRSLKQTGVSMMYTSFVLFSGFIVFTLSDFGGTIALGGLSSFTLLVAMLTNLILLPALLDCFHKIPLYTKK